MRREFEKLGLFRFVTSIFGDATLVLTQNSLDCRQHNVVQHYLAEVQPSGQPKPAGLLADVGETTVQVYVQTELRIRYVGD